MVKLATSALMLTLASVAGGAGAGTNNVPLLGANYIRYQELPPACSGPGVVHQYDRGIRRLARVQLAAMRAAGMRTLRLVFYHSSEGDTWGLMRSAGGRLAEPYRTNLIHYLQDVRAAGFESLTVAFNPWSANDPIGYTSTPYDPTRFEENWELIRDVRPLVKQFGPATTRLDLLNEGAPHWWQPELREYVVELWKRYVDAFGAEDATVSVIANPEAFPRLPNLVEALRATGRPLPRWFDVHVSWSSIALDDLRRVDAYLGGQRLAQPLVLGEQAYDNAEVAEAIAQFMRKSSRPILEVMEWPLTQPGTTFVSCPNPPYRIAAYARALTKLRPYALAADVARSSVKLTSDGMRVTALAAGSYTVTVRDRSIRGGFRLVAGRFDRRTSARFRGTVTWRVRLWPYQTMKYGPLSQPLRHVEVLGDGGG